MVRISQIKLGIEHTEEDLKKSIAKALNIPVKNLPQYNIVKRSIDARKKDDIKYSYTIEIELPINEEQNLVGKRRNSNITITKDHSYRFKPNGDIVQKNRPIIVGLGPAGLFCAYLLAEQGYQPLVIERGDDVDKREEEVNTFWQTNKLNLNSNVQFGEGGAGTFSDGKLNTMVKDEFGRNKKVLEVFVEHGAPSDILYLNKPHIGTNRLRTVIKNMRKRIIELGGEVKFQTKLTDIEIKEGKVNAVIVNETERIPCETLVMAIGHSARDTFSLIYEKGLDMIKKSFAIGVRIQHPQRLISKAQYGSMYEKLAPADYKLTHQAKNGRGIYSFCMCPGGFVVNSSSEEGRMVVNGMSNYERDEENANSALIVTVTPEDFDTDSPLAGVEFQRKLEGMAYQTGKGNIPVQLFGDFVHNKVSSSFGSIKPVMKGNYTFSNLRECLPSYVSESLMEGIYAFDHKIHGFSNEEAILAGVESRTSSPLRIIRNEEFESNILGIYPCGEGAGYAGGITSAAMDGIKVYEAISSKYKPC